MNEEKPYPILEAGNVPRVGANLLDVMRFCEGLGGMLRKTTEASLKNENSDTAYRETFDE